MDNSVSTVNNISSTAFKCLFRKQQTDNYAAINYISFRLQ